ncbi:group III truncated hemoglobin, partial [uncultured Ruegeria sp.]
MTRPTLPPRFPATPEQINAQVRAFYARVRQDAVLGPVFANHVTDWSAHEEKIASFWRNAILFERSYDGNP